MVPCKWVNLCLRLGRALVWDWAGLPKPHPLLLTSEPNSLKVVETLIAFRGL